LIALALFLSAPVSSDLRYGQVSLFLGLLVLVDIQRAPPKAQGILIGLAAAIKLTPLIFIPMLWLGGRRRAALTATATFLACGATAALILPSDSWRFWTTEVRDVNRLGFIDSIGNQSLNGALIRLNILPPVRPLLALFAGGLIALIALYRARKLARTGDWPAATIVVGAASIVLSPVSWTHHQIWLVLAAFLARHAAVEAIGLIIMILPVTAVWGEVRLLWAIAVAVAITYGKRRPPRWLRSAARPPKFLPEREIDSLLVRGAGPE
jgi:alpha-1,2-mannosyltransferase